MLFGGDYSGDAVGRGTESQVQAGSDVARSEGGAQCSAAQGTADPVIMFGASGRGPVHNGRADRDCSATDEEACGRGGADSVTYIAMRVRAAPSPAAHVCEFDSHHLTSRRPLSPAPQLREINSLTNLGRAT